MVVGVGIVVFGCCLSSSSFSFDLVRRLRHAVIPLILVLDNYCVLCATTTDTRTMARIRILLGSFCFRFLRFPPTNSRGGHGTCCCCCCGRGRTATLLLYLLCPRVAMLSTPATCERCLLLPLRTQRPTAVLLRLRPFYDARWCP